MWIKALADSLDEDDADEDEDNWVHGRGYEGLSQAAGWTPPGMRGWLGRGAVHRGPGNLRGIAWEVTRRSELYFIMVQN